MLADQAIFKEAELYIRLFISTILGLFIGWDRSSHNKPAGIKTYTYVTVSCTLITIISIESATLLRAADNGTMMDPMRLAAQIVSGLGFLGAGLIMKNGFKVKGLTSAAMIFFAGGVGIGIGVGFYGIVIFSIMITFLTTKLGSLLEKREQPRSKRKAEIDG
ncbi:MgtC/SapB family protein [Cytobacillus horneckiae]|uniref:MgtC/SapB/SrpB/YhiD N-terminal domain-containing protein n=1 Tax=Cytobacillus horneckiae TaxID=549687 RepID=A0A2N0ZF06_9BACI|nr:MgtC/SapB family protein [Cytobacillus horneckiae]MBN6889484.1 MgtC/SapB family protein [Cytobacillus horneckiae]MCM3176829.1 MgtC/SapB family protein [Cytobacillus horneckiae]MEC1156671.1 MgtC/SapB family protein [Cytobacillus horneckiae]MED2939108.1 MgtC/SapB family protein [Cytobacillus horneckiae]PKG28092.1 hypothetical protein CWS20_15720 [Cytobacillus horneckiae]